MKKLLMMIVIGMMMFTFVACGSNEDSQQVVSPFVDYDTVEEALEHLDFDIMVPEQIDGYDKKHVSVMDETMFQVIYRNEENEICIRKQKGEGDISGDSNEYEQEFTSEHDGREVLMRGNDDYVRNATWTDGEYAYSIYTDADMTQDDIMQLISLIQ